MNTPDYNWFVKNWRDSAYVQLLSDDNIRAFIGRVTQQAESVGREDIESLVGHCLYRALYEQDRFGSIASILDDIEAPAEPSRAARILNGPLGLNSRAIKDTVSCFPAGGVGLFWLPYLIDRDDLHEVDRLAEWCHASGLTYVRWFGAHDWPGGTSPTIPHYWELMARTLQALRERNLRSHITAFTRRSMIDDPLGMAKEWGDICGGHKDAVVCFECCNEYNHLDNGPWPDDEVRAIGHAFRSRNPVTPLALSAPAAETFDESEEQLSQLVGGSEADAITIHLPRYDQTHEGPWRWVRQPWHTRFGIANRDFIIDNEHTRWDKSNGGRKVEVAAASILTAFISGCGMSTHHDLQSVHINHGMFGDSPEDQQLSKALSKIFSLLPSDLPNWTPTRLGTGGGPHPFPDLEAHQWTFNNISHGVSRSFAAVRGQQFVMVLNGVRDYVDLNDVQTHPFSVVSLKDGETVYDNGRGPVHLSEQLGEAFMVITNGLSHGHS